MCVEDGKEIITELGTDSEEAREYKSIHIRLLVGRAQLDCRL